MEQLKPCNICGQEIAKFVCKNCGAHVGNNCYDKKTGLCIKCLQH